MKRIFKPLIIFALSFTLTLVSSSLYAHPHIVDVEAGVEVSQEDLLKDLRSVQVIFMGEFHDHVGHHQAQLAIIDALDDDPERPLAVGLEMFRRDSQKDLDVWTANKMPLLDFLEVYNDNWSMWPEYSKIFMHARNQEVKMVGLNIPRKYTRKVASTGFNSLSSEERLLLGNVQCEVDETYGNYIRQAMGGYGGHGQEYLFFCEAQLLWDTMMARNLIDFLKDNPDYRVVVMAGSGHSWKFGIPRQLEEQADISYRVLLPEIVGRIDRNNANKKFTDYLWLDVGDDGWGL
jgi:uncharacterized iron-regulated protein